MGSKDSFTGGGGKVGSDLREGIDDWLANLPGGPLSAATPNAPQSTDGSPTNEAIAQLSPRAQRAARTALLFKTSSGTGSSSRRAADAQFTRSAAGSARIAGRGAAAAYAYRTGDRDALRELGLDYDQLRANPNTLDVVYRIAQAICEELPPGTIETDEQLHIVAEIAEWIVEVDPQGGPTPAQIAQETLAVVLTWAFLTTTASELNTKDMSGPQREAFKNEVHAACEELAAAAKLDPSTPSATEFASAIESGLEFLQATFGRPDE